MRRAFIASALIFLALVAGGQLVSYERAVSAARIAKLSHELNSGPNESYPTVVAKLRHTLGAPATLSSKIAPAGSEIGSWDSYRWDEEFRNGKLVDPGYEIEIGDAQGRVIEYLSYTAKGELEDRLTHAVTPSGHQITCRYEAVGHPLTLRWVEDLDLGTNVGDQVVVQTTPYDNNRPMVSWVTLRPLGVLGLKSPGTFDTLVGEVIYLPNGTTKVEIAP